MVKLSSHFLGTRAGVYNDCTREELLELLEKSSGLQDLSREPAVQEALAHFAEGDTAATLAQRMGKQKAATNRVLRKLWARKFLRRFRGSSGVYEYYAYSTPLQTAGLKEHKDRPTRDEVRALQNELTTALQQLRTYVHAAQGMFQRLERMGEVLNEIESRVNEDA